MISVTALCERIEKLISTVRLPLPSLPAALVARGAICRPGMSPMMMASTIIRRSIEAGVTPGPLASGAQNKMEAMERIRCEVIVNAIKNDMKITTAAAPGTLAVMGPNGPSVNADYVKMEGIAQ